MEGSKADLTPRYHYDITLIYSKRKPLMNSNPDPHSATEERVSRALSGWLMLPILFGLLFGALALLIYSIRAGLHDYGHPIWSLFWTALFVEAVSLVMSVGFV